MKNIYVIHMEYSCECAMFQAVSRRHLIAEAWVQFQAMLTEICGVRSGIGAGFPPRTSVSSCKYHSTNAPY
jgi:hypothetical protein